MAVELVVPLKVGGEGEVDAERGPRDGLDVADEVELGELGGDSIMRSTWGHQSEVTSPPGGDFKL